jgi:hypothetical protein
MVNDLLDHLGAPFDAGEGLGLQALEAGGVGGRLLGREGGATECERGDGHEGAAGEANHQRAPMVGWDSPGYARAGRGVERGGDWSERGGQRPPAPSRRPRMRLSILSRRLHRWGAVAVGIPFLLVIVSGLLLQVKKQVPWVQPVEQRTATRVPMLPWETVLAAAQAHPEAAVREWTDIDRLDVRPSKGIVKVITKSRWELQLALDDGRVLQTAYRRSDLIEQLHDGSFFGDAAKLWIFLPSGLVVFALWLTGLYLWLLPMRTRRRRERLLAEAGLAAKAMSALAIGAALSLSALGIGAVAPREMQAQRSAARASAPYVPGSTWEHRSPSAMRVDSAALAAAIAFAVANEARAPRDMEESHYRSFGREPFGQGIGPFKPRGEPSGVILRGGYVIASWGEPDRVDMTHSVTKSFLSAVVGIAFDRGLVTRWTNRCGSRRRRRIACGLRHHRSRARLWGVAVH